MAELTPKAHDGFTCSRWPVFGNCPMSDLKAKIPMPGYHQTSSTLSLKVLRQGPTSGCGWNGHWESSVNTLDEPLTWSLQMQNAMEQYHLFQWKAFKTLVGNSTRHPACTQHPSHSWSVAPPRRYFRGSASAQRDKRKYAFRTVHPVGQNCSLGASIQDLLAKLWKRETHYRAGTSEWSFLSVLLVKQ